MQHLTIKPLSVNEAWKGKRYKTDKYKQFERDVLILLKPLEIPQGPLKLTLNFGFSTTACDADNPVKPFIDCLQKKYNFNDNRVYSYLINKRIVKKGQEYIRFKIEKIDDDYSFESYTEICKGEKR